MGKKPLKYQQKKWETLDVDKSNYIRLARDFIFSPAFVHLSPNAIVIYIALKEEYKGKYTDDYRRIDAVVCPYATLQEKTRFCPATISKGIKELQLFGFIDVEGGGLLRTPNVYHFAEGWKKIDEEKAKMLKGEHKIKTSRQGAIPLNSPKT